MIFGEVSVADAEGAVLAHSARLKGRTLKKGHILSAGDLSLLEEAGYDIVTVARLEEDDVPEDEAAGAIAAALAGTNVRVGKPFTGRCNLFAEEHGILTLDQEALDRINLIDEAVTVATPVPFGVVAPGQMIATIKIIPFAVSRKVLDTCLAVTSDAPSLASVAPFQAKRAGLIMTRLPGMKERLLDNTARTVGARLEKFGSTVGGEIRCAHKQAEVAQAIEKLRSEGCDPILIFGASATVDRRDTVPAAMVVAGGTVDHFGMPVDPGNLLVLGHHGEIAMVGMPGCARSPKINGFDWVLWRVLAGLKVTPRDIMRMGAGGLLKETELRTLPRRGEDEEDPEGRGARAPNVAALILAAGASTRMGKANKLLADIAGIPMVVRAVEAALHSQADPVVVVTGHEFDEVEKALEETDVTFVHNPDFAQGLSTSLRAGLGALPDNVDGVIVGLGDMPGVTPDHFDQLIAAFDPVEGRSICVPVHGRKRGNPVLWGRQHFQEMASVTGDVGARHLLEEHADEIAEVAVTDDGVLVDVDTPARLDEVLATIEKSD